MTSSYPAYKQSGIDWLGQIPSHWTVDCLKWSTEAPINGVWGSEPDGEDDIACIRVADFDRQAFRVVVDQPTYRAVPPADRPRRLLRAGDLLIEKSGGGEKQLVGAVVEWIAAFSAVTSNFVAKMTCRAGMVPRFWTYVHAHLYAGRVNYPSIKQTTGIQNLDAASYLSERVAYPPEAEQVSIATFLDRETARIDALIERKRRLLQLLEEKRFAVITQTVTKGLDLNVPMKDSGVAWIGETPSHWDIAKGRHLGTLFGSPLPTDAELIDFADGDGIPFAKVADLNNVDTSLVLTESKLRAVGYSVRPRRLILFPKRGAAIFTNKVVITNGPWLFDSNLMAFEIHHGASTKYIAFCLMARRLDDLADVSTVPQINNKHIYPAHFPRPPLDEQVLIVSYLEAYTERAQLVASKVGHAIQALQEYRSALITNAVTGKIDVRGVVAKEVAA